MEGPTLPADGSSYVEALYREWLADPNSVDAAWGDLFREAEIESTPAASGAPPEGVSAQDPAYKQSRVDSLLWGYRDVGYLYALLNPLAGEADGHRNYYDAPEHTYEQLTLPEFGLAEADLAASFSAGRALLPSRAPLADIVRALRETYCAAVGVEFLHIQNKPIRRWLIQEMESTRNKPRFDDGKRMVILEDLVRAEEFEHFLHSSFVGQKRFSLEGAESVIPALHHIVDSAEAMGIEEIVMGMTHRGRLTVLNRILDKPLADVFGEFEGGHDPGAYAGSGDVKYHLGYHVTHAHPDGSSVEITLLSNPSHLEAVDAVVEGKARGIQERRKDSKRKKVLPVILHGDAAFSGQGVVAETFNLSTLKGYRTGGTVHIVINNQIGFSTSARDGRSTFFPTDVAKVLPVPIFHVNGDDAEAVVHVVDLALRFRQTFGRDAVVDIFCYRKYGHNEGDDPSFTHPLMYKLIERKPSPGALYAARCRLAGLLAEDREKLMRDGYRASLREAFHTVRPAAETRPSLLKPYVWGEKTGNPTEERLRMVAGKVTAVPDGFHIHPKLKRIVEEKTARLAGEGTVDWAFAESLSFGSLLLEGIPVRLCGQDTARGTFSQRHLTWWDVETPLPHPHTPLAAISPDQAEFNVYDSPLSEYSVLAFEYGFSLAQPRTLVLWEAQFGDFSNGAQVVIDNFIAAAESKWGTASGLVLLLPHGYEGQGPEHSSGHLERFLILCAQDNMEVCNCSTPAQYFHLLRRQALRSFRKPLVVMTPKSLLRHPKAVSPVRELAEGGFQEVLDDPSRPAEPERLLLCSGKVYYDLAARREKKGAGKTALVRVEQLHPFPHRALAGLLSGYPAGVRVVWVQEEPRNRGAWTYFRDRFETAFPAVALAYVGRAESASPATGSHARHEREQEEIAANAFDGG